MRAVRNTSEGVRVVELPEPEGDGERVSIVSAGICGSDLSMISMGMPACTIGHEMAGVLEDGTPVAVEPIFACRTCDQCVQGAYNRCRVGQRIYAGAGQDGGMADAMLQRVARMGDGWLPVGGQGEDAMATMQQSIVRLREYASRAGRDPSEIGVELVIPYGKGDADTWRSQAERSQEIGATHVQFSILAKGITVDEYGTSIGEYVDRLHRFYDAVAPINADAPAPAPVETED